MSRSVSDSQLHVFVPWIDCIIDCPSKQKVAHSPFAKVRLFALITKRICCGIVLTTLFNVTTFISIQSCIRFWPRFWIDDKRMVREIVKPFLQSFPLTPNTVNVVKVRTSVVASSCVKMTPRAPSHSCVLMLHSFTTRAWWILPLSSWNMLKPSGKKK